MLEMRLGLWVREMRASAAGARATAYLFLSFFLADSVLSAKGSVPLILAERVLQIFQASFALILNTHSKTCEACVF